MKPFGNMDKTPKAETNTPIPRPIGENGKNYGRFGDRNHGWVQHQRAHLGLMRKNKKTINKKGLCFPYHKPND
jgi:hypothetical protein